MSVVFLASFPENLKGYSLADGLFSVGLEDNLKVICDVLNEHKVLHFLECFHKIGETEALLLNDAFLYHIILQDYLLEVEDGLEPLHILVEVQAGVVDYGLVQTVQLDYFESGVGPVDTDQLLACQSLVAFVHTIDRPLCLLYLSILFLHGVWVDGLFLIYPVRLIEPF